MQDDLEVVSYLYNSFDLILTYSLAFIATTISVMFGLYASLLNRGSYQNRFSTFIRATRDDRQLRNYINQEDQAADPRPKAFTTATVQITGQVKRSKSRKLSSAWMKTLLAILFLHFASEKKRGNWQGGIISRFLLHSFYRRAKETQRPLYAKSIFP